MTLIRLTILLTLFSCAKTEDLRSVRQKMSESIGAQAKVTQPENIEIQVTSDNFTINNYMNKPDCISEDASFQNTSVYSHKNQLLMTMAATISGWKKKERIDKQMTAWGAKSYELFGKNKKDQHRGFAADMGDYILLAFRGTSDVKEFFLDLSFIQTGLKEYNLPGKAHLGFKYQYSEVRNDVMALVDRMDASRDLPIFISGHSLGGAVGVLAAAELKMKGKNIKALYTSAAPRLGDTTLTNYLNKELGDRYFRLEQEEDLVTHVPPRVETKDMLSSLLRGFMSLDSIVESGIAGANYGAHAGIGISFSNKNTYVVDDLLKKELDFWSKLSGSNNALIFSLILASKLPNHETEKYLCQFHKNADKIQLN